MKNLEKEEVAQLLQVIQKKPAQRIVHFCENTSILNESLATLCKEYNNVFLFISKSGYAERDEWRTLLEEHYYVSVTIIDNIFKEYDVISAKRMHGWGN